MLRTISLSPGALRWWIAPLAYFASMVVLVGVSLVPLPAALGQAAVFVGYVVFASGIALLVAKARAGAELGVAKPVSGRAVVVVAGLGAVLAVLLGEVAGLINKDIAQSTETVLTSIGFGTNGLRDLVIIGTICCLAPLGEEALYRGLIFRSLFSGLRGRSRAWPAAVIAAALAAVVFAFSHGGEGQEASVVAVIFLSGVIYGLCYAITGSLWAAVLAHSINNAVAVAVFAFPSESVSLPIKAFIAVAPVLSLGLLWLWARVLRG